MSFFKSLLAAVFSRFTLVLAGLTLAGLAIWCVGPLLAIGALEPLASLEARVGFIALLLIAAIVGLTGGSGLVVLIAATALLLWFAGPLLSVAGQRPLASVQVRWMCLGVLALLSISLVFYRLLQAVSRDPQFFQRHLSFARSGENTAARREALRPIAQRIGQAVAQLRSLQSGGFWRRTFEKNRHLYALPWFLLVGGPGSGKTAALRQSGLQFPLEHTTGHPGRGVGATRFCDCWLANEAVFIDTAGRYCAAGDAAGDADPGEWRGLLGLLRKHRPRAPVNGVVLFVSVEELMQPDADMRAAHARLLRERLSDIRHDLGIRCPVYLVVTKTDLLRGFSAFFQSLTSEGRTQVWGFPLDSVAPARRGLLDVAAGGEALQQQVTTRLSELVVRLQAGLRLRLKEEFEVDRRRRLFTLPLELQALSGPLVRTIGEIFLDSRFDDTQSHSALRGVYFTSAEQALDAADAGPVAASADTETAASAPTPAPDGAPEAARAARERQGFFLHDLMRRVVIPGAHLVRPNLRWALRFRLLRASSHGLALLVFLALAMSLTTSWRHNRTYLDAVQGRMQGVHDKVAAWLAEPRDPDAVTVLDAARRLPAYPGQEPGRAASTFGYGLATAPAVATEADTVYARLQERMLLPALLQRMETALADSLKDGDAPQVYATLRAYKLLHDKNRYLAENGAADVRAWVLADPHTMRGADAGHVESLFSGGRALQAGTPPNQALVHEAQRFLEADTSSQRIYERAKAAMLPDAPPDFTLVRAVGPQVGTVFARRAGLPLETGVPGLFTRAGYRDVFDKRLAAFVARASHDDAWVMDRNDATQALAAQDGDVVLEDIRRQYLDEYTRLWDEFLDSIQSIGSDAPAAPATADAGGSGLGFELSVLRQLAAPDSALSRLARAVVAETSLAQPLLPPGAPAAAAGPVARPGVAGAQERERVDSRFAALRELVTGQADVQQSGPGVQEGRGAIQVRPGLEAVTSLVNGFYTQLVVADIALAAGGLPPGGNEAGPRLALEAAKLPPPLRQILLALARSGNDKLAAGAGAVLRRQAQTQFDRIVGLMAQTVGEPCRRGIEGRYPFAASAQDAAIEDVTHLFAVGGAADDFFHRHLESFVDTSVRPWRYRTGPLLSPSNGSEGQASAAASATATGPTLLGELLKLLARGGPELEAFYRAQQIRELFFTEGSGRKLGWSLELSVLELEPTVTELLIDIDGQGQRYVHGPVRPLHVDWPGPRGGAVASLSARPAISGTTSTVMVNGPWALLRLLDKGRLVPTATAGRISVELGFDGRKALLGISTGTRPNPLNSDVLRGFRCPGAGGTAAPSTAPATA